MPEQPWRSLKSGLAPQILIKGEVWKARETLEMRPSVTAR